MIYYLRNEEIDKSKWDRCIWNSPNGLIYAFSWYLDIICENWDALVEDDYVSVMPLPINTKFNIAYCYQPFWAQQLGIFSTKLLTADKTEEFIKHIPAHIKYIDINFNNWMKVHPDKSRIINSQNNYQLDLIIDYQLLSQNYSENHKRNLKKVNPKLTLLKENSPNSIVKLFIQNKGKKIKNITVSDYKKFLHLVYFLQLLHIAKCWGVYNEHNQLVAGAIFFVAKGKAIMIFSAVNEEGKRDKAMFLLIDSFIREYSSNNLILDFEGSNDPNLARFYEGFGAKNTMYTRFIMSRLSKTQNMLLKLKRFLNNLVEI